MMLGAEWIGSTQPHGFERLVQMSAECVGLAQADESTERTFTVGRSRINKHASHRLAFVGCSGVDSFSDAGRRITALDGQLPDHCMGKRMQEDIADRRI